MPKRVKPTTSRLAATPCLARRDLGLRFGVGAILANASFLCGKRAVAADGNVANENGLFARVRAATLIILVDGQQRGSGTLIDASGFAITAAHVIQRKGRRIEVVSASAERMGAEVIAVDLGRDLALLRLPTREGGYPFLPLAPNLSNPGADAFYLGTPVPMQKPILLRAMVSGESITFTHFQDIGYIPVLTLAASMPRGSSGGAFVDADGALLGVLVGGMMQNGVPAGFVYASPSEGIRNLLTNRENAKTPLLGMILSELWRQHPNYYRLFPPEIEGLFISSVTQNSPSARAAVKEWDLVVEAEGRKVTTVDAFFSILRRKNPNDQFSIGILEPGVATKRDVTITLGLMESSWR